MDDWIRERHERHLENDTRESVAHEASFLRLRVECQSVISPFKRLWTNQMFPRAALAMGLVHSRHVSVAI